MFISEQLKPKGKNTSAWQIVKEILHIERTDFSASLDCISLNCINFKGKICSKNTNYSKEVSAVQTGRVF